jgi:hypothetical protein
VAGRAIRLLTWIILSGQTLGGPRAAAEEVSFEGQSAWNAPLGGYGVAVGAQLSPFAAFAGGAAEVTLGASAGVGMQIFNDSEIGLRWAVMPRLRLGVGGEGRFGLAMGVGISQGKSQAYPVGSTRVDAELSLDHRWQGGLKTRVFGGYASIVDSSGGQAQPFDASYLGLGLGYTFQAASRPNPTWSIAGWYGWQSLALDVLALAIPPVTDQIHAADAKSRLGHRHIATGAMIGVYLLSGPSVHAAHRRWRRAALSTVARVLLPLAFGVLGRAVRTGDGGGDLMEAAALGGGVLASLGDAVLLGRD